MINKNEIKSRIRENAPLLKSYHVNRIGIFGSFARGTATEKSDVDRLVDFSDTITLPQYVHLTDSIKEILDSNVDLVTVKG